MNLKQWQDKNKTPSIEYSLDKTLKYIKNRDWYSQSNETIKHYYPVDYNLFIDLLSITSPRNSVKQNTLYAIRALDNIKYKRDNNIIYGIANKPITNNLDKYIKTKQFNGVKINNFAGSLKLKNGSCCIDTWMLKAFNLKRLSPTPNDIIHINTIIKAIAAKLGLKTYEVQACLWVYAKSELNGGPFKELKDFSYYLRSYFEQTKLELWTNE